MCSRFRRAPGQLVIDFLSEYEEVETEGTTAEDGEVRAEEARPTDQIIIVKPGTDTLVYTEADRWGFSLDGRQPIINGRIETILERPLFAQSFRERRCLIPCDGFYEWKRVDGKIVGKFRFGRHDSKPLLMGGIWREHRGHVEAVVLTTSPNVLVEAFHDRMPVLIDPAEMRGWLTKDAASAQKQAAVPYPAEDMAVAEVPRDAKPRKRQTDLGLDL